MTEAPIHHPASPVAPSAGDKGESSLTVLLALAANAGVGILKLIAGLVSGSSALLSEAAHSVGDCITEIMLLVAQKRSARPADRSHPFGYGKERYFWSLIAAVGIFVAGAMFSFYQGYETIVGPEEDASKLWINYPVLALAAILEGTSLRQAAKQMKKETKRLRLSLADYVRTPRDPTVNSVLLEDSAAILGLAVAALGVALHQVTGNKVFDGVASIVIGLLLLTVTLTLARACETLLVGKQADRRFVRATEAWLEEQPEVVDVVDLLTMMTGVDSILLCARVDFVDTTTGGELEETCVRLDREMREKWPFLDEIFIQPAPRGDELLRQRVTERYGRALAEE
ncbi:cation diffusion facilitator family transporter [Jatrophihabitans endophyticus]|uniref:Cation diffusion facilitator family transporter n=1 Tax=Jatrophihabitans endophyticus TaxID=1206085 RepID=A0A1M5KQ00_9ACTN|nr:cation diffusion facilitator family transporter [Jatrophihabitans endophyticus]SHG54932.1 cation diffusion facilitator family transporter [Jatrophihabitans endophyticus]